MAGIFFYYEKRWNFDGFLEFLGVWHNQLLDLYPSIQVIMLDSAHIALCATRNKDFTKVVVPKAFWP